MILEQLISAYLDGELSAEQDAELRSQISSDPAAREAFDSSVLIHIALRCEDDTAVPEDLRTGVFDAVDACAQENVPQRYSLRATATVAVLLAVLCLPIRESFQMDGSRIVSIERESRVPSSSAVIQSQVARVANVSVVKIVTASAEEIQPNYFTGQTNEEPIPVEERFGIPASAEVVAHPTLASVFSASSSLTDNMKVLDAGTTTRPMSETVPTRVTVSTMYAAGGEMINGGASDIRQFSASIGYGVAESDIVGLEVGSTTYSIDHQTTVLRANGSYSAMTTTQPASSGVPGKLTSPDAGRTEYSTRSSVLTSNQSSAWGSAFYERRVLQQKGLSLNARAGAGFGEDGALGYGRLQCEWQLGGIISLVVGGEARLMPFRTGTHVHKISSTTYGTAITGITGIHLRF